MNDRENNYITDFSSAPNFAIFFLLHKAIMMPLTSRNEAKTCYK